MTFKKITDELFSPITADVLANELGCSVQSVRQARMAKGTGSYREPPPGWQKAVAKLADRQASKLMKLAERVRSSE